MNTSDGTTGPRAPSPRSLPLHGLSLLLTRSAAEDDRLGPALARAGARVACCPAIEVIPLDDTGPVEEAWGAASGFDWLVWTSPHGVSYAVVALSRDGKIPPAIRKLRVASVGPSTSRAIETAGFAVSLEAVPHNGTELARRLLQASPAPSSALLFRGNLANPELPRLLREAGWRVQETVCYLTRPAPPPPPELRARLEKGEFHFLALCSGSAARWLAEHLPPGRLPAATRLASLGPSTSRIARELGYQVTREASPSTPEGMISALARPD